MTTQACATITPDDALSWRRSWCDQIETALCNSHGVLICTRIQATTHTPMVPAIGPGNRIICDTNTPRWKLLRHRLAVPTSLFLRQTGLPCSQSIAIALFLTRKSELLPRPYKPKVASWCGTPRRSAASKSPRNGSAAPMTTLQSKAPTLNQKSGRQGIPPHESVATASGIKSGFSAGRDGKHDTARHHLHLAHSHARPHAWRWYDGLRRRRGSACSCANSVTARARPDSRVSISPIHASPRRRLSASSQAVSGW